MSRKTSGKTKKAAPISLAWLRQVIDREWPDDAPAKGSIVAVAAYFIKSGDPDGRNVFPAIDTMARDLRLGRHTILGVTKAMQAEGMLERVGKIRTGTINYRLRLEAVEVESVSDSASDSVPRSASSSAQRGTLPTTYDRKGVGGGGGDGSPDGNTPAAVATGSKTGDAKTIVPAVMIDDDRANRIIIDFITAFDARFAKRERSSTVATQRLEPHRDKLRLQIVTKIDAGWPQDHLIDRIIAGLPADDRKIGTLTGLVASKLHRIPDKPDATARQLITEREVAAAAAIKKKEADRKRKEADRKREIELAALQAQRTLEAKIKRREDAIADLRAAVTENGQHSDIEGAVASILMTIDAGADTTDDPEAARLDRKIADAITKQAEGLRRAYRERCEHIDQLIIDAQRALGRNGCAWHDYDARINAALAAAGIDRNDIKKPSNHFATIRVLNDLVSSEQHITAHNEQPTNTQAPVGVGDMW